MHVRASGKECKFSLESVSLARNRGIPAHDLKEIERLVYEHQETLSKKYHEYHGRCFICFDRARCPTCMVGKENGVC